MGRMIEKTYVGAYIRLGEKTWDEIHDAFVESEYNEEFDGEYGEYLYQKIEPLNMKNYKDAICPPDDESQITGEITVEKINSVKEFVQTKYATEIDFLKTIFGTAEVIVGTYDYDTEIG